MTRQSSATFVLQHYPEGEISFTNDFVAHLPGLIITQFSLNRILADGSSNINTVLRFDFIDDWYSVLAFLDENNKSTGHFVISAQTPLQLKDGIWKGCDLILKIKVQSDWSYSINGEEDFLSATDDGWMRVYFAVNARDTIQKICSMLNDHTLPPEIMDAVNL